MIEHALSTLSPFLVVMPLHFSGIEIAYISLTIIEITALMMNNLKLKHLASLTLAIMSLGGLFYPSLDIGIQYSLDVSLK